MKLRCWKCGEPLRRDLPRTFPRLEQCKACGSDLHVCRRCHHYAPRYISQCAHDTAEPPRDRELANFCQHFRPDPEAFYGNALDASESARRELDTLFNGGAENERSEEDEEPPQPSNPFDALNALFNGAPDKNK